MQNIIKNNAKIMWLMIGIVIFLLTITLYIFTNKPGTFSIIDFNQELGNNQVNLLTWSKSEKATKYTITISVDNGKIIKEITTIENSIVIDDIDIKPNDEFIVNIIAYNSQGKKRVVQEEKVYKWQLPVVKISDNTMEILSDDDIDDIDITVLFVNEIDINDYYLVISKEGNEFFSTPVNGENITINKQVFKDLDNSLGIYEILLCKDINNSRVVFNKVGMKILLKPITNLEIIKPLNNIEVPCKDLLVEFNGGENANDYYFTLKDSDNKIIIENEVIYKPEFLISVQLLNPNTNYELTITALHQVDSSIKKNVVIKFKVGEKDKVSKIISTKQSGEIGINRAVRLSTGTENAEIYYTIDGSTPKKDSILYTGSIFIDKDMTIKAIAIAEGMKNSDIIELNYKAVQKEIAIYLSPSIQSDNVGIEGVGYTTEMEMMNKVSNYIEARLKSKGIIVYRNERKETLAEIVDDSSSYDVDMHLAIHSNSYDGKNRGIETWIHDDTCEIAEEIATVIQQSLLNVYYDSKGNRGVKYSTSLGGMRETNPKNVTNGVLVEVAFHDHYEDAKWIVNNQMKIGYAIADAVAVYFGK